VAANSPALTMAGRLGQVHASFRQHSPATLQAAATADAATRAALGPVGAIGLAGRATQPQDSGEPVLGSRPMTSDRFQPGAAHDRAKDRRHDDGVVGVAQHRDEVGYQNDPLGRTTSRATTKASQLSIRAVPIASRTRSSIVAAVYGAPDSRQRCQRWPDRWR
jgi:hypothetical protein